VYAICDIRELEVVLPSLLYNGFWVFPEGKVRPGRDADPSPLLVPRSKIE